VECALTRKQLLAWDEVRSQISSVAPESRFHFAASSSIWNAKKNKLKERGDWVRPGISLYGVPPWWGAPARGLMPVMTVNTRVIRRMKVKPYEKVGYGGTFQAGSEGEEVAVIGHGYADGVIRSLGGRGKVWLGGKLEDVLGRVSRDMTAVRCSPKVKDGDWAEFFGDNVSVSDQAHWAQTIPYELLVNVSPRVERDEEES
jgi:alanine racemase